MGIVAQFVVMNWDFQLGVAFLLPMKSALVAAFNSAWMM